jgi:hypothetical protein
MTDVQQFLLAVLVGSVIGVLYGAYAFVGGRHACARSRDIALPRSAIYRFYPDGSAWGEQDATASTSRANMPEDQWR